MVCLMCFEPEFSCKCVLFRKVDVRLPEKGNSNSHGARPVHLIITMIKWIRTSRFSIKNSLPGEIKPDSSRGGPVVILID